MARPRYPSDEKRARPFARIHLTTRTHPTYGHVFANVELRGMVYGLWQVARGAFAGETKDVVTLALADVEWITDRTGRHAVDRFRKVCDAMSYTLTVLDAHGAVYVENTGDCTPTTRPSARALRYRVHVRNLQRKQWPNSAESRSKKKKTKEEDEEESLPPGTRKRAPSEDAVKFAQDYLDALKGTGNLRREVTEKTLAEWTVQADRMLRRDGVSLDEARSLCAWIFRSEDDEARFWRATARSVRNFRRNYDQINAQRERAKKGERRGGDVRSAIARVAERHGA